MNKKKILFLLLWVLLSAKITFSQIRFHHLIGGPDNDRAQTVFNTFDNGYILNGASFSFGVGDVDANLIKTDIQGQVLWSKAYGTSAYDNSEFAIETFDHNIVCTGRSNIQNGFPTSAIIFKTDSAGNLIWSKSFGGLANDGFAQVIETSDNGYALVGNSESTSSGSSDVLLVKTNINGDTIFSRSYGTIENEAGTSVIQLPDNGFVICGRQITFPGGNQSSDGLLLRTDAAGNLLWSKLYGDSLLDELTALQLLADGGYIVTGSTSTFGQGGYDILLMKSDNNGNLVWSKTFGGNKTEAAYDIHINPDSSFFLSGYTESYGSGNERGDDSSNVFLMKTNVNGDFLWMEVYGDGLQDEAFRSAKANDGGYIIPGFTTNYLFNDSSQMLFIKTDSLGISGCHEEGITPVDSFIVMPVQNITLNVLGGISVSNLALTETTFTPDLDDACLFASVNRNELTEKLNVFPNPFNERIEIKVDNYSQGSELLIADLYGKEIKSLKINSSSIIFQTNELEKGAYIFSLKNGNKVEKGILVIKN